MQLLGTTRVVVIFLVLAGLSQADSFEVEKVACQKLVKCMAGWTFDKHKCGCKPPKQSQDCLCAQLARPCEGSADSFSTPICYRDDSGSCAMTWTGCPTGAPAVPTPPDMTEQPEAPETQPEIPETPGTPAPPAEDDEEGDDHPPRHRRHHRDRHGNGGRHAPPRKPEGADGEQDNDAESEDMRNQPCPCPRVAGRLCPDGVTYQQFACGRDRAGKCRSSWKPCSKSASDPPAPAPVRDSLAGPSDGAGVDSHDDKGNNGQVDGNNDSDHTDTVSHDGDGSNDHNGNDNNVDGKPRSIGSLSCPCPDLARICDDGTTVSSPTCSRNEQGDCSVSWSACPPASSPVRPCPCPRLAKPCAGGGVSSAKCTRNGSGDCHTSWTPCPAITEPCACPALARLCPDGSAVSPSCQRDSKGVCQTSFPSCP